MPHSRPRLTPDHSPAATRGKDDDAGAGAPLAPLRLDALDADALTAIAAHAGMDALTLRACAKTVGKTLGDPPRALALAHAVLRTGPRVGQAVSAAAESFVASGAAWAWHSLIVCVSRVR